MTGYLIKSHIDFNFAGACVYTSIYTCVYNTSDYNIFLLFVAFRNRNGQVVALRGMRPKVVYPTYQYEKTSLTCRERVGMNHGVRAACPGLSCLTFLLGLIEALLFPCESSCSICAVP